MIQQCWMDLHNEKLDKLRDKLELQVEKLQKSMKKMLNSSRVCFIYVYRSKYLLL